MRILHLAWEYPPVMYGGLGRHVHALANAQADNGHEVVVITQAPGHPAQVDDGPVHVLRAGGDPARSDDLLGHVAHMEWAFCSCGEDLFASWRPDVVHAHDWMVAHAAVALRDDSVAPLVTTIHATEAGRNRGWITTGLSTTIHSLEWWLANASDLVITCSQHMDGEVRALFGIDATSVIANGIDRAAWQPSAQATARIAAENADASALVAYTGRVEWEKGVQTVVDAMPRIVREHPGARLLVAGRGSYLPTVQAQAGALNLGDAVRFLGWVSEEDLRAVVAAADVAIAPSLYEPFGLTALEAAAIGTPLVVSATGGLSEFARGGELAATFRPGDADGLAAAVGHDLDDPRDARSRAARASRALERDYEWHRIADLTVRAYSTAVAAASAEVSDPRHALCAHRRTVERPRMSAPLGRLLDVGW